MVINQNYINEKQIKRMDPVEVETGAGNYIGYHLGLDSRFYMMYIRVAPEDVLSALLIDKESITDIFPLQRK